MLGIECVTITPNMRYSSVSVNGFLVMFSVWGGRAVLSFQHQPKTLVSGPVYSPVSSPILVVLALSLALSIAQSLALSNPLFGLF